MENEMSQENEVMIPLTWFELKKKIKNMEDAQEGFVLIDAYSNFHLPVVFNDKEAVICDENSPRFGMSFPLSSVVRN